LGKTSGAKQIGDDCPDDPNRQVALKGREPTPEEIVWETGLFIDEIKLLMINILGRALEDLQYSSRIGKVGDGIFKEADRQDAADWMLSDSREEVFDFLRITDAIGADPEEIRKRYKTELKTARSKQTSFV